MTINLHNKTILVTREEKAGEVFADKITSYGGRALTTPLLGIKCLTFEQQIIEKINRQKYAWLFFTSKNGVDCFFNQIGEKVTCRIAAVGEKTAQAVEAHGYEVDFIPTIYKAETMAREFFMKEQSHAPVLFVRGKIASSVLPKAFTKVGRPFDCVEVYDTVVNDEAAIDLEKTLDGNTIDFITFTSPSTVEAFMELTCADKSYCHIPAVCIGTTTERSARELGFKQIILPDKFTIEGMLTSIYQEIERTR